jgi:predicted small secreted protein
VGRDRSRAVERIDRAVKRTGARVGRGGCSIALACAAWVAGCDLTLQGVASDVRSASPSSHAGALAEARLHLPRDYTWTVGGEVAHLGQLSPATVADQWRVGVVGGQSALLRPDGARAAPEVTARVGIFRGSNGELVRLGEYAGLALAAPIRISPDRDPWELDELVYATWMIVPQVGATVLVPGAQLDAAAFELAASIGLRLNLSSTLLP